jgi:hypothetical protein
MKYKRLEIECKTEKRNNISYAVEWNLTIDMTQIRESDQIRRANPVFLFEYEVAYCIPEVEAGQIMRWNSIGFR